MKLRRTANLAGKHFVGTTYMSPAERAYAQRARHASPLQKAVALSLLCLVIGGCESAVKNAHSTALNGDDLVAITDNMAAQLGSDPAVNAAIAVHGPLKIVVTPVVNRLRAEIIPAGQATAFTGRVRMLLAKHSADRFTWIMNRDAFYALRGRELETGIDPGPAPEAISPEYALTATFSSLTNEDRKNRDTFYVCLFQLTNLQNRTVLWSSSYEMKKKVVRGFLD